MTLIRLSLVAGLAAIACSAAAATITPVSVTATNTFDNGFYTPDNLINGSGLTNGLHDGFFGNMWATELGVNQAQVTFDLGAVYDLSAANIWQFNYADGVQIPGIISTLDRGVKDFRILTSNDGVTFTEALTATMLRGDGQPAPSQDFAFSATARYVQIDILNNYAQGTIYERDYNSGLSEVRFQEVVAAVPEPASWAMMIAGFGLVGGVMRRRTGQVALTA